MNSFTKLALLVCLGLAAPVVSHPAVAATIDEISARLDAFEKENAALRARLNRLEASKAAAIRRRLGGAAPSPALASLPGSQNADAQAADLGQFARRPNVELAPHFEIGGSLLFLQPGAGNLEYATLVIPLPSATPIGAISRSRRTSLLPSRVGGPLHGQRIQRYRIELDASEQHRECLVLASPTQMVGPPYLIGPKSALYKIGYGDVQFAYNAVNLDAGHTFCAECSFQLRAFGGVEVARIGQNLTGTFQSPDGRLPPPTPPIRCLPAPGRVWESRASMRSATSSSSARSQARP